MRPARSACTEKVCQSAMPLFCGVKAVKRPVAGSKRLTPPAQVASQIMPKRSSVSDSTASEFRVLDFVV